MPKRRFRSEQTDALAYDTAVGLLGFENPTTYSLDRLGAVAVELSCKLRGLAIVALLTKGDADKFCHNLMRSGLVRELYQQRMREHGLESDRHLASGRYAALLDALVSGALDVAQRIALASPRIFAPQCEYEDDFAYAQVLHNLICGVTSREAYTPLLTQFAAVLKGAPSPRLDVVAALIDRDQARFDKAFAALLAERKRQIRADEVRAQPESPIVLAERQVFIEGLALLSLAERQGLQTQGDYIYCPALARRPLHVVEPRYFVMVGEGEYPVMPIDTGPKLAESWRLGQVVTLPEVVPLTYVLDTDYEGQLKAIYYEDAVPVMRDDVVQVLRDAGVDNIQFADAVLVNPVTGQRTTNYKAYNIVGLVAAADMRRSSFLTPPGPTEPKTNFLGLHIDEQRAAGLLLFRLAESPNAVVVHASVKAALERSGIRGIVFYGPGTWSG